MKQLKDRLEQELANLKAERRKVRKELRQANSSGLKNTLSSRMSRLDKEITNIQDTLREM